ncbi:MAG TPA: hydroxymethylglutaryl-CoA lyase [Gammaproteobacteria bacterium]|nr:hydroxymethylglutaryl-CoA lyase [Gammaproteobacteria bacterium]
MSFPKRVRLVEVGARDGLQNEKTPVSADVKVDFINRLSRCGLATIEATSFVSPTWIPQLADAEEVYRKIDKVDGVAYPCLVPNEKGIERAIDCGVKEISVFTAASETFNQKNINASIAESIERFKPVVEIAAQHNMRVRGYISCVLGCPYEGPIAPAQVADVVSRLADLGCYEISLGDTIGVGTPLRAQRMLEAAAERAGMDRLAVHFHNTYSQALANLFACLELGVSTIDASVSGLGGCPYAKGAAGNVATEDVVYMLHGMSIETGVDFLKLLEVGDFINGVLNRTTTSRIGSIPPKNRQRPERFDPTAVS